MMLHKKLQKVLAIALMTSFFTTSFVMGVSEAAPARHYGGYGQAQQQVRPAVQRSSHGSHRYSTHRNGPSHHAGAPGYKRSQAPRTHSMQKSGPYRQGPGSIQRRSPVMQHRGPVMQRREPIMQRRGPGYRPVPIRHESGPVYRDRGPVVRRQYPEQLPPPPPPYYRHDHRRSMHREDWLGALVIGGIIGAIIANNTHHHANNGEYIEVQ